MKTLFGCIAFALLLVAPAASAQQVCNVAMSYRACIEALNAKAGPDAQAVVETELDTMNTGGQSGADTATDDFNPRVQAGVDTLGRSGNSDGVGLTLSWNDVLQSVLQRFGGDDGTVEASSQHHKLVVKLEEADLFEPLEQALADEDVVSTLRESLTDFDDVTLSFRLSVNSKRFGRDLASHAESVGSIQRLSMTQTENEASVQARLDNMQLDLVRRFYLSRGLQFDQNQALNARLTDEQAAEFLVAVEAAHAATDTYVLAYEQAARANGLFDVFDLVSNQPQVVLSIDANERDDLVGPDARSLKFSYEFGGVNMHTYERYRGSSCTFPDAPASETREEKERRMAQPEVDCLADFVVKNRAGIDEGNRFAVSLEYRNTSSYRFDGFGTTIDLAGQESLVAKLTYGRYVNLGANSPRRSRIDVTASFEDVSDDPNRQNRAVAKATFAQEISDGLFLEVGVGWASKPEFLTGFDDEASARVGINYKLARRQ